MPRVRDAQPLRSSTTAAGSPVETSRADAGPTARPHAAAVESPPQAELIRQAWSALAVGEPDRALTIVDDDERLHHDGALDEEREAVRIVALARLGRLDEARRAATQFARDYPASLHHDLVERALAQGPDQDR